jgi:hypothetical protein
MTKHVCVVKLIYRSEKRSNKLSKASIAETCYYLLARDHENEDSLLGDILSFSQPSSNSIRPLPPQELQNSKSVTSTNHFSSTSKQSQSISQQPSNPNSSNPVNQYSICTNHKMLQQDHVLNVNPPHIRYEIAIS